MMGFQRESQGPTTVVNSVLSLGSLLGPEKGVKERKENGGSPYELLT